MATTSNYQLPYPEPSDPVNVAEDIELLAKKIDTSLGEIVQDTVGGMVSSNTENGISVTYNDDLGKLNFNVTVIPTQTENEGKFLTTNGTSVSWEPIDEIPDQTGNSGKYLTTDGVDASWDGVDGIVPTGGDAGQILIKVDGTDYNTEWIDNTAEGTYYLVRNNTGSTILKGTLVSATGAEPSGRVDVAPHETTGLQDSELRVMGVVTANISNGVNGTVMSFGTLKNIDTRGSTVSAIAVGDETWAEGDILYAHPTVDGKLTKVRPQHDLAIAFITVRHATAGQIAVRIVPGNFHLEWLHDVDIVEPTNNQILAYDSATSLWKNVTSSETGFVEGDGIVIDINEISVDSTVARLDSSPTFTGVVSASGITNAKQTNALVASGYNSASGLFDHASRAIMTAVATGSAAPTTRPDGTALVAGDIWISF